MNATYEAYYKTKLESGLLYQDFVVDLCFQTIGLVIVQYSSRVYQTQIGESRTGVEIKHDEQFARTRNLWIEVAEKARPRQGDYVPSGIERHDNTWLYIIGDYNTVFVFPKRYLLALKASGRYPIIENRTKTSVGFLLSEERANSIAAYILTPHAEGKVATAVKDLQELGRRLHALAKLNPAQLSLFARKGSVS